MIGSLSFMSTSAFTILNIRRKMGVLSLLLLRGL